MSSQGYSLGSGIGPPTNGTAARIQSYAPSRSRRPRYWLHLVLLLTTLVMATAMGARMAFNFYSNRPTFNLDSDWRFWELLGNPSALAAGLPFSLTLLTILLAHEFGHYVACRYYGVEATLPYFIPAPTLIGTFGAFIRIRSPIYSKRVLFDIGIAGPLSGFVVLLPALAIGLAYSKILPAVAHRGEVVFGVPTLLWLLEEAIFPGVAHADIYLHPVARAAWVGMFATALNLLPIGQLDGGHILYSFTGERHRMLSKVFAVGLVPLGLFFWSWWLLWALVLLIFGLRHPSIFDSSQMGSGRKRLGWLALIVFVLCFMAAPVAISAP